MMILFSGLHHDRFHPFAIQLISFKSQDHMELRLATLAFSKCLSSDALCTIQLALSGSSRSPPLRSCGRCSGRAPAGSSHGSKETWSGSLLVTCRLYRLYF